MNNDRLGEIDHIRTSLREDLNVADIGLPTSTMLELEDLISRACRTALDCLTEIGATGHRKSLFHVWLHLWRPRVPSFQPLSKGDWRERIDSLLSQIRTMAAGKVNLPEWILEKELETISMILNECADAILRSRANQAAFPFSAESFTRDMVVRVGELADQPETRIDEADEPSSQITVSIYVDGEDSAMKKVLDRADRLVEALGYGEPIDEHVEHGSIFRRYKAAIRRGVSSREIQDRLIKAERAIDLLTFEAKQAQVDQQVAAAVSGLVASFSGVSRACVRVGSILFVKYSNGTEPIVLVRTLSAVEMDALERYPEIQTDPVKVFQALAMAISKAGDPADGPSL